MNALDIVLVVVDALERLSVPYMLVGSFSSNRYGIPRSTKDADFVVQLPHALLQSLITQLGSEFDFDPRMTFETITSTMRYRMRHRTSAFQIELFELSNDPHDQARFARRRPESFAARTIHLPSPEDVIITKLRWSKGGNRRKDVDDVLNVLAVQAGHLDLPYIRHWTDTHSTRDLFEQLLLESTSL